MKVAAGCIFYNSEDIISLTIENLITHGVTDFFLINHASDDNALELIQHKLNGRASIRIINKESKPFLQGRMMSLLAIAAKKEDFNIFIPFDSDEFIDTYDSDNDFKNILLEFSKSQATHNKVPIIDYVQKVTIMDFVEESLENVRYRAEVKFNENWHKKEYILSGGTGLVSAGSFKVIINLDAIDNFGLFQIQEGNHELILGYENFAPINERLVIRHLPFRSMNRTKLRAIQGSRRRIAGFSNEIGFQNQQLELKNEAQLSEYWLRNSWESKNGKVNLAIPSEFVDIIEDFSLAKRLESIREARETHRTNSDYFIEILDSRFQNFFENAIDLMVGFPEVEKTKLDLVEMESRNYHLSLEIKGVRQDHDILASRLNQVLNSASWRFTKSLRTISGFMRSWRRRK